MMLKQFTLIISLFISSLSLAQEQSLHTDDTLAEAARDMSSYQIWEAEFNDYLLQHPNSYVQAIGLSRSQPEHMPDNGLQKDSKLNDEQQKYVDHINQLAQSNTLRSETIYLLLSLCSNHSIKHACHRQALLNKHSRFYPDDMIVYFEPLAEAVNNHDNAMAEYMIKNMRDAKYTTDMTALPETLKSTIKDYLDKNPVPQKALIKQLNGFTDIDASIPNKELNQAFYYILISGIKMALPIPGYKKLLDYCSSELNSTQACVKIADTLITQGNDIITQLIGHRLMVNAYQNTFQTDLLIKAESKNDEFRSHYKCITNALSKNLKTADYMDITYAELWLTNDNELQRIKSAAQYLYNKGQTEGYTDLINPEECKSF